MGTLSGLEWITGPLVLLALLAGCGGPDGAPAGGPGGGGAVILDLASTLGAAGVALEAARLEIGRPEARPHLVAGWSYDETDAGGPFAWSVGGESEVELFAAAARDFELGFLCRPFERLDGPLQRLTVTLNGHELGEVRLEPGFRRYRLDVPASAVVRGTNRLRFSHAYHRSPRDVVPGAEDDRELAAAWRWIAFRGLGAAGPPRVQDAESRRLELPAGAQATTYLDVDGPAELVVEALEGFGPRGGDLELLATFRTAGGPDEAARRFAPGEGPVRWRLAGGPAIGRLTLAAVPGERSVAGWLRQRLARDRPSGLALARPAVRSTGGDAERAPDGQVAARRPRTPTPANVLVYLIDTLRADHLGVYGYPLATSPRIDRFAADAIVFADAQAQSSWTRPAVASLFTGLDPRRHGVHRRRDALPGELDTLAELLARAGFDTAGFVTNGNVAPAFAFDQGFGLYRYLRESGETPERHQLSDRLNAWAFDWLEDRADDPRPFFLYLHATDPHAPYAPREPWRRRFAPGVDPGLGLLPAGRETFAGRREGDDALRRGAIGLYDAEIAFNDHHFGRLLERLRALGLYDDTLIVLLSDHGEEFFDHGSWKHGKTLYGEQLHVPLIVRLPGGERGGSRVADTARQVDVLPTVLDALGIPAPPGLDGTSLLGPPDPGRRSFADLRLADREVRSVTARGFKLILDASPFPHGPPVQLYHLARDRGETAELSAERPFEGELLSQVLRRRDLELAAGAAPGEEIEIPEELRRQLEALGYL